jgi:hypothetical protein
MAASVMRMCDETGATLSYSKLELYLEFDKVQLVGPSSNEPLVSEEALKEWVWQNCKDSLLAAMSIKFEKKETPEEEEIRKCRQRLQLLDTIAEVQRKYLQIEKVRPVHLFLRDSLHMLLYCLFRFNSYDLTLLFFSPMLAACGLWQSP